MHPVFAFMAVGAGAPSRALRLQWCVCRRASHPASISYGTSIKNAQTSICLALFVYISYLCSVLG